MLAAMSSSSQYLPNPRKRPREDGAPEFPCLPGLSFDSVSSFALESQLALRSVNFSEKSLFLPLISPHRPQVERFKIKEGSIFIVVRNSYSHLKKDILSINYDEYSGIYVRYIRLLT
jgi:hypothetical protein